MGSSEGLSLGSSDGSSDGSSVGSSDGSSVGGPADASLHAELASWEEIEIYHHNHNITLTQSGESRIYLPVSFPVLVAHTSRQDSDAY